jgi:hypothetical protein
MKVLKMIGYVFGAFWILAGLGGNLSALAAGVGLLAAMLLATNAWGIRVHVPLVNSPQALHRRSAYMALVAVTLLATAILPSQTPEERRAQAQTQATAQAHAQATQTVEAARARPTQTALARAQATASGRAHARALATAQAQAHAAATTPAVAAQDARPTSTPSAAQWEQQASQDTYADVNDHPDLHQGDKIVWTCNIAKFLGGDPNDSVNTDIGCWEYRGTYDGGTGEGEIVLNVPPTIDTSAMHSGDDVKGYGTVDPPIQGTNAFGATLTDPQIDVTYLVDLGHDSGTP